MGKVIQALVLASVMATIGCGGTEEGLPPSSIGSSDHAMYVGGTEQDLAMTVEWYLGSNFVGGGEGEDHGGGGSTANCRDTCIKSYGSCIRQNPTPVGRGRCLEKYNNCTQKCPT